MQEKLLKEIKSLGIKEFDNFNSLNLIVTLLKYIASKKDRFFIGPFVICDILIFFLLCTENIGRISVISHAKTE